MQARIVKLQRLVGYITGFLLFYEPFMLFHRLAGSLFEETGFYSLHVPCARIPLANILTGDWAYAGAVSLCFCLLVAAVSLWFGPLFCGRLCPAGAFSEFLGSLLPEKYQIDWGRHLPIVPLRYGFWMGFLLSVAAGFGYPCAYCNYYALELFTLSICSGKLMLSSVSLTAAFLLSNILLGLFTSGGRGYCNFLCPVGASCSLLHRLGQLLPGPCKMTVGHSCIGCGKCVGSCPMRAVSLHQGKAVININHCIVCGCCSRQCPTHSIHYRSNISKEL